MAVSKQNALEPCAPSDLSGGAYEIAFRCHNVAVEFETRAGPSRVLENVDLDVQQGEFVSVIGTSGTGKTTLLRALGGLQRCVKGSTLEYKGIPISGSPLGVAFVFQDYRSALMPWRTVARNVELGLESLVPRRERSERVKEALAMVGLEERADDYAWRLSGGMQQRVQIARAMAMKPEALLMDEPFGALDAMTKGQLQDELQRLHQLSGATIVFVTHDVDEAVYLSDRILVLAGAPSSISREIDVDLARPRDQIETREDARYLELRRIVHAAVHGERL